MIKGLAITPPIIGRITIGKLVTVNDKVRPEKDDQFTITSQLLNKDGWIRHPIDQKLRAALPDKKSGEAQADKKLRSIPVRMIFNDPDLNLRVNYTLFDRQTGRQLCVGDGMSCQRKTENGVETLPCPSPDLCQFAKGGLCKPFGRLHVNLDESDELGTFIFRTTGYNSIRTLAARLAYYKAASTDLLAFLPLQLTLRGKCTRASFNTPVYYVDLTIRDGISLNDAIYQARQLNQSAFDAGFSQDALDAMARQCYDNALFDLNQEDGGDIVSEFYHEYDSPLQDQDQAQSAPQTQTQNQTHLQEDQSRQVSAVNTARVMSQELSQSVSEVRQPRKRTAVNGL